MARSRRLLTKYVRACLKRRGDAQLLVSRVLEYICRLSNAR